MGYYKVFGLEEEPFSTSPDPAFFYESAEHDPVVAQSEELPFKSQYLRQVFARALGSYDNWNWRVKPLPNDIEATIVTLGAAALHS